jgi:hypothetical protein
MKATLPGKPGLTKTALLAKPGPTTTALPEKPGLTTTAPPRDQAKTELGTAISAISKIILTALIAFLTDETPGLAADGMSFPALNSSHLFGEDKTGELEVRFARWRIV